jgi:hypothetical protein
MRNQIRCILASILLATPVFGHSVWIEPASNNQLIIRLAEPDGKFEKSPGHLDELTLPAAWTSGDKSPTAKEVQKKSDHFLIIDANATAATQIETRFQVMATPGKPGRLPFFYARWAPDWTAAQPALILDIVPTDKAGEARVFFRGKPLAGIKATLRTPDEKEQALVADQEGILRFDSKQSGQHLLTVAHHREALPGFAGGRTYDLTSHNAALTWIQK